MRRKIPLPGGDLEHAVLLVLWELGEASAPDIPVFRSSVRLWAARMCSSVACATWRSNYGAAGVGSGQAAALIVPPTAWSNPP